MPNFGDTFIIITWIIRIVSPLYVSGVSRVTTNKYWATNPLTIRRSTRLNTVLVKVLDDCVANDKFPLNKKGGPALHMQVQRMKERLPRFVKSIKCDKALLPSPSPARGRNTDLLPLSSLQKSYLFILAWLGTLFPSSLSLLAWKLNWLN